LAARVGSVDTASHDELVGTQSEAKKVEQNSFLEFRFLFSGISDLESVVMKIGEDIALVNGSEGHKNAKQATGIHCTPNSNSTTSMV